MKKLMMLLVIIAVAAIGIGQAGAYTIEIQPGTTVAANSGDLIFFDVIFNPDTTGNVLGNYGFNLLYDNSEMTWNIGSSTFTPPAPLAPPSFAPVPFESPAGKINNISGVLPFGATGPTLTSATTLASFAFDVSNPVNDATADVWFDVATGTNFNIDGNVIAVSQLTKIGSPDVIPAQVPVAPEPISSVLFLVGGATLGFRRFAKRKTA